MIATSKAAMVVFGVSVLLWCTAARAEEVKFVLVGQTHAMLYPCHCPIEPDGGIMRRATLLNDLGKKSALIIVDSGSFFAAGAKDQSTLGQELDKVRTDIHVKAMERMQYDAALIGEDEFNFGRQYLEETSASTKVPFLACNINSDRFKPYVIKKFGPNLVGIIGVASPAAAQKAGGLQFQDPVVSVRQSVEQVTKQGAGIIILLSGLDENTNRDLLKEMPQINILVEGAKYAKEKVFENEGQALILAPRWEGRRLVVATLALKGNGLSATKVDEIRVSDKLADDKQMRSMLPACFSNAECKKEAMIATCQNPGQASAQCQFTAAPKVNLTVISKPDCRTCDTTGAVYYYKREIAGLIIQNINYPSDKADKLIKELGLTYLPVYLFGKEIEKEKGFFDMMKVNMEAKGAYYIVKAQSSGVGYFLGRQKLADRLDVFMSIFNQESSELLDTLREFSPQIHFLIADDGQSFQPLSGNNLEVEEAFRAVCIQKYSPARFYGYLTCRAKDPQSAWWDDCAHDVDTATIKQCAQGEEGRQLLRENISLNRQLEISNGPTYLFQNQEIFASVKVPKKEELRKLIAR